MNRISGSFWLLICLAVITLSSCSITIPVSASAQPIGPKVGKSSGSCYFGICIGVDASILTAAENGGITTISTVDFRTKSFLGLVKTYECIVTGQ